MRKIIMRIVLPLLAILGFAGKPAHAETYGDLLTPMCVIGFENIPGMEKCASSFPAMRTKLEEAHHAWKRRNAESLKKISILCKARLNQMFEDYDIRHEERRRITEGARQFFDKFTDERARNKADFAYTCHELIGELESDKMGLLEQNVVRDFAEMPVDIRFMRAMDGSFRKDAPAGTEANYSRDRGLDYAEVVSLVKSLKIGKVRTLSPCLQQPVGVCISKLGRPPDEWRTMPSGEEHLIYYGKKLLFRGTPKNNRTAGLERRIFVAKDGKITDAHEVVQALELNRQSGQAYDSCETYGGRGTSLCPSLELIK